MTVIASLLVNVKGQTSHLGKALATGRKQLAGFRADVGKLGSLPAIGAGLVGAVAGSAFGVAIKGAMDTADAAAKTSDQLGIATEKLIGLQHAGDLAGVSQEQLAGHLQKLNINLAKAAGGDGPAVDALKSIGLSAQDLIDVGPDQALGQIADGLLGVVDPARRAQVAQALFGKSGAGMISMLAGGAEGLRVAQAEAEKFGIAINRTDAAKIEAANDAFTRVSTAVKGLATQAAVQLAPFLELAAVKMQGLATAGGGAGAVIGAIFRGAITVAGVFADALELGAMGFYGLRGAANLALSYIAKGLEMAVRGFQWLAGNVPGFQGFGQGAIDFLDAFSTNLADSASADFDKVKKIWEGPSASQRLQGWLSDVQTGADAAASAAGKLNEQLSAVGDVALPNVADDLAKLEKDLRDKLNVARLGETEAKLQGFAARGADGASLDKVRGLDAKIAAEEFAKKTADPFDTFKAKVGDLERLFQAGAIDSRTLGLGKAEAASEAIKALEGKDKKNNERTVDSLSRGSAAAINAELAFLTGGKRDDENLQVARETLAASQRQVEIQKQQAALLAALVGGTVEV